MKTGERIKSRRKELKMSADEVADKLGKNRATVYRYESNEIEDMPLSIVTELSKILKVNPAYLMGWTDLKEDYISKSDYHYLPTTISAGLPIEVEAITETEKISIPDSLMGKWANQKDILIMRINGESMNKTMPDRSIIAVKPMAIENLKDGDIVVYSVNHDYSVKRLIKQADRLVFRPHSTEKCFVDDIVSIDNNDLLIHGKVVLYIVEMD